MVLSSKNLSVLIIDFFRCFDVLSRSSSSTCQLQLVLVSSHTRRRKSDSCLASYRTRIRIVVVYSSNSNWTRTALLGSSCEVGFLVTPPPLKTNTGSVITFLTLHRRQGGTHSMRGCDYQICSSKKITSALYLFSRRHVVLLTTFTIKSQQSSSVTFKLSVNQ